MATRDDLQNIRDRLSSFQVYIDNVAHQVDEDRVGTAMTFLGELRVQISDLRSDVVMILGKMNGEG